MDKSADSVRTSTVPVVTGLESPQTAVASEDARAAQGATNRWVADACLIATAVMWGVNIPLSKYVVGELEPFVFNGVRLVLAAITLAGCAALERRWLSGRTRGGVPTVNRRPLIASVSFWSFILLTGLIYQLLFIFGISRTTAANSALLLSTMPMWTAMISFFALRERLPRVTWWGLGITFMGAVWVINARQGIDLSTTFFWGNLMMMSAALCWAAGTVISRRVLERITPLQLAFWSGVLTAPIHLAIAWPYLNPAWETLMRWKILLAVAYSGIFSTGLAYVTWHIGVRRLGGSHAAVYQNLVTLVAVLGGWLLLREQPLTAQIVGGILIIGGLVIMRRGRKYAYHVK